MLPNKDKNQSLSFVFISAPTERENSFEKEDTCVRYMGCSRNQASHLCSVPLDFSKHIEKLRPFMVYLLLQKSTYVEKWQF